MFLVIGSEPFIMAMVLLFVEMATIAQLPLLPQQAILLMAFPTPLVRPLVTIVLPVVPKNDPPERPPQTHPHNKVYPVAPVSPEILVPLVKFQTEHITPLEVTETPDPVSSCEATPT